MVPGMGKVQIRRKIRKTFLHPAKHQASGVL
jgi:hypothetical protein